LWKVSQTICDAIRIVKGLGFTQLRVDALCIIQDSNQSKIRELSVMHQIYENSSLTIAAASVASADRGFLEARIVPKRKIFKIPYRFGQEPILYNQHTRA
jgi:Heterokaryon incompatibility protein (HET)